MWQCDLEVIASENVTYRFHNVCQSFCLHKPNMPSYHQDTNSEKKYNNLGNKWSSTNSEHFAKTFLQRKLIAGKVHLARNIQKPVPRPSFWPMGLPTNWPQGLASLAKNLRIILFELCPTHFFVIIYVWQFEIILHLLPLLSLLLQLVAVH